MKIEDEIRLRDNIHNYVKEYFIFLDLLQNIIRCVLYWQCISISTYMSWHICNFPRGYRNNLRNNGIAYKVISVCFSCKKIKKIF